MRGQGAKSKAAVVRLDPIKPLDVAQAHETARLHQALPHHGHESGAARDDPRVLAILTEDGERLVERPGRAIVEGVHARLRSAAARIDSMIL